MQAQRKPCFIITWQNNNEIVLRLPRSRWMLGTKEFTKNMKITTVRTDTHFTKRTLSVILCCGGEKYILLSHDCLHLSWAKFQRRGQLHYWDNINGPHSQWVRNVSEVKYESLPSFAILECFAPSSYPLEIFVCQTQQHFNLLLISVFWVDTQKQTFKYRLITCLKGF